jgi:hypothetical protein
MVTAVVAGFLVLVGTIHAAESVEVYVNSNSVPGDVVAWAEKISSRMFASAGVAVSWHAVRSLSRSGMQTPVILMDFQVKTPEGSHPGAMAYALPYEGVHITVLYDRIRASSRSNLVLIPMILANVMTHEITHILEGIDCHAASGIMKAHWDETDFFVMTRSPLKFTARDIDLIREGTLRRNGRMGRESAHAQACHAQAP